MKKAVLREYLKNREEKKTVEEKPKKKRSIFKKGDK